jgi:hypothetical protein
MRRNGIVNSTQSDAVLTPPPWPCACAHAAIYNTSVASSSCPEKLEIIRSSTSCYVRPNLAALKANSIGVGP